jgi:Domain of Unknown Function with PDB structure (DUF3857)/Transglutaminase-like superfamily
MALLALAIPGAAVAAPEPPSWLQAQVTATVPDHDADTNAVTLYAARSVVVQANGRITRTEREVYRILRPDGVRRGVMTVHYDTRRHITALHGWSIPTGGKPYFVDEKHAYDSALTDTLNGLLMSDLRTRILQVPAEPGSVVGFESVEVEDQPYVQADDWVVQDSEPVAQAHYSLQLPPGWQYQAIWFNHDDVPAVAQGPGQWQWDVTNVRPIRAEESMPPLDAIHAHMSVSLVPAGGAAGVLHSWHDLGVWYQGLTQGRRDASPAIKHETAELTAAAPTVLARMQNLADFVQNRIRYVGIELGVGGYQPHPAAEVFDHAYGDCKDKVTLLSAMLKEIGIDSFYVVVNSRRGAVTATTPANLGFDHVIVAIQLPAGVEDPALLAVQTHPKLGRLLFFDPTNTLTPLGRLDGELQSGYGLLIGPDGGELLQLPQQSALVSGVQRHMQMRLDAAGNLSGDVDEHWTGDAADSQRAPLKSAVEQADRIKSLEPRVADSLARFEITGASIDGQHDTGKPLDWHYSLKADQFAKTAGDLLLVRPRVLGVYASGLLETEKPRQNPIVFSYLMHSSDVFDIALPSGYVADDLPPAVDADYGFASYHSSSTVVGHTLRYSRTFEIKALQVPVANALELKDLYRIINSDELRQATLKPDSPGSR